MTKRVRIPGVGLYKPTGKWRAYVHINGKLKHLGYFDTQAEAAEERAIYDQDHHRTPKEPKAVVRRVEPRAQSQERRAAPAPVEKPAQPDPFALRYDHSKPLGPDNYDLIICYPQVWEQIVRDGRDQVWLAAGAWWRFHRYSRLEVWDAEVRRVSEACDVSHATANAILLRGLRDEALANPAQAEELAKLADPAQALGVADLV